ncbi:hypothetical protein SAMD00019534_053990 [Acytostelium subglobosum LB1]|uniref:hypothetical protein n=1 Tax=Acytostelium subglobosum LB1 TaxID=1410327 RepID=UPI000644FC50|nr:hypothetical protein SAMD00019534_053990 [Acytostelium subglobosum LB1]GAM22224.1 hypothetical protein SAMD00019534_053990 [Acytostelium subglobosum LB1]|eukprot:XP_012755324.1 hypothetical protein SAMD00019534_053990 [Acytostelium subglobosum LB1]
MGAFLFGIVTLVLIYKSSKFMFMTSALVMICLGGFGFFSFVIDSISINDSKKWCNNTIPKLYGPHVDCTYDTLIITVLLNTLNAVLLIVAGVLVVLFRNLFQATKHVDLDNVIGEEREPLFG